MKARVISDRMNLNNEGTEVKILTTIPEGAKVRIQESFNMPFYRRTRREVYLVTNLDRMQKRSEDGKYNTVPVSFSYQGFVGTDLLSADEIEIMEEV